MKRYFGWLILLSLTFASCEKLDQEPEATVTNEAVFGSEAGLQLYSNSFYDVLPTANDIHQGDAMADYSARTQVPDFLRTGAFSARQSSGWDWTRLRNINYFIANCNNPAIAPAARNHYLGLARFFRAWFYFDKVKRFGDVPWISKPMAVNDPALYNGRDPRTLVMDSVLADLNFACQNLNTTADNSRSLITRQTAFAFKSRVCLFEGTFRKYHTSYNLASSANTWLTEAASAANTVMTTGGFSLNTAGGTDKAYRQLFTSTAVVPSETILAAVVDPALSIYNDANWWWTSATYGARVSLIRTFVNTYLNIDGTPFTSRPSYETMPFAQEVKNRDKRLQQTIRMGDYKRVNGGVSEPAPPVFSYTYTGYQPIKWTLDDTYYDGGSRNINSIPIIRYAEVLLNFAEAKAELGTFTDAEWVRTVGALRQRAGITGGLTAKPTVVDTYLQTNYFPGISNAALLEIRRERGVELALEGLRFYDLVRWHRGELMDMAWNGFYVPALDQPLDLNEDGILDVAFYTTLPANRPAGVTYINVAPTINGGSPNPQRLRNGTSGEITWLTNIPRRWEEKYYLYPIPETDRLLNPKLGQNPGW
ncbi:RagB/SusD family nutrient uptake outer membrane protein [Hymenobacter sp. BT186]|uniref:RagB/SusD family nutrient uptake outer membrane protein n=1 Tax=Hymenobacter telluris TaxID=2816474 RepID=A0A939EVD7_9BACT|nr:RagB/SusD family nutrient uptake outer membrane protein [Hymenobacter telluris]MBO0358215.1 RagB/SusD family nutrient uptake outer membrane protein [Hymenobacter telluris]MBW3374241.1 RagB/SusD family nutrient uptake outer membrane protein [Hymenobacter norwichensis]